jgi:hypothetical protein
VAWLYRKVIETNRYLATQPIDIALEGKVARTMLRIGASQARHMIDKEIKKIRQQMRSKRGRQARVRKTLGQSKEQ